MTAQGSGGAASSAGIAGVLHNSVLDVIGRRITAGELTAGQVLTLDKIQQQFAISRTVARETMRLLESLGLATSRRRVGIIVQPKSSWQVFDPRVIWWRLSGPDRDAQMRTLTELRIAVEPMAAAAAARGASAAERARAVELAKGMRELGEAGELKQFLELDIAFHALLLTAGGNEMFAALTDVIAVVLEGRTTLGLMPHRPEAKALDLHETVAHAVADGRSADAENAMRELLGEVREAMRPSP
ncbi:FadR/GntR family transcriptional regulator [Hoyosella subflava]|uniref:Transcriptional regulator, GntR family n=1 Tax=Hoyosella subflava (strain DSM 45089 / JCM 17490 / NBRC 109087 / DQS3-9A1) TaxID=443218 RepID=F6EQQ4_HOYSD|nr:FCD domain-containing protein [Hoyosella subflava]AEF41931.1 Transcriptional regulator, GntR family [Hoyosella subflava DQS3-9A1]